MDLGNGKDGWTEDDFTVAEIENQPLDDPWAITARTSADSGTKSSHCHPEKSVSKEDARSHKTGIFVPSVERIQPFQSPSSDEKSVQRLPIDRPPVRRIFNAEQLTGKKEDPWGFEIPSRHPPTSSGNQRPNNSELGEDEVDFDWSAELGEDAVDFDMGDPGNLRSVGSFTDDQPVFGDGFLDEPEISAEYEEDIYEELFQTKIAASGFNRNLAINEWLASLGQLDGETVESVTNILSSFTVHRCAYWINWLRQQTWDEYALIQFFSFRELYEFRNDYWRQMQFQRRFKKWQLTEDYYSLSLNKTLMLIQRRINIPIDEIIDDEWLFDWSNLELSILYVNNCLKFSDFALYRSGLSLGEDWKRRADLGFDFESEMMLRTRCGGILEYIPGRLPSYDRSEPTSRFDSDAWLEDLLSRNAIDTDNLRIDRSPRSFL